MDVSPLAILVDAKGNPVGSTFGSPFPTTNILGVSTGTSAGMPIGGLSPSGNFTPLAIDAFGSLTTRPGQCPTWTATSLTTVTTGTTAGKSMLSIFNGSTTNYQRLVWMIAQCPPQANTTGGLAGIGSGTTYTQIPFALYRITGHSGGTSLTKVSADPADDSWLDSTCTIMTGATLAGKAASPSYCWDAAYNAMVPMGPRPDVCTKTHVMPPGTGLALVNVTALSSAVSFLMTATCTQSIA